MNKSINPRYIIKWISGPYKGSYWCKETSCGVLKDKATKLTYSQLEPIKSTFQLPISVELA